MKPKFRVGTIFYQQFQSYIITNYYPNYDVYDVTRIETNMVFDGISPNTLDQAFAGYTITEPPKIDISLPEELFEL